MIEAKNEIILTNYIACFMDIEGAAHPMRYVAISKNTNKSIITIDVNNVLR